MADNSHWHPEAFLQNRWTPVYRRLCDKATGRTQQPGHEEHHLIPESFFVQRTRSGPPGWLPGNPDEPTNLAWLSWREHRLAHRLLRRIALPAGQTGMRTAEWFMTNATAPDGSTYRISSRQYERLKSEWQSHISGFIGELWQRPDYQTAQSEIQRRVQKELFHSDSRRLEQSREGALAAWEDPDYVRRHHASLVEWAQRKLATDPTFLENSLRQLAKAQEARRDKTVYRWTHADGHTFVGTRADITRAYNLPSIKQLFTRSGKNKTAYGWRVAGIVESPLPAVEKSESEQPAGPAGA